MASGFPGLSDSEGSRTTWDTPDGSYVQVTTNNGVVNNKMQYGLSE